MRAFGEIIGQCPSMLLENRNIGFDDAAIYTEFLNVKDTLHMVHIPSKDYMKS
jgi:hypothetical protein